MPGSLHYGAHHPCSFCNANMKGCLFHQGSGFIAYGTIMAIMLLVGEPWIRRSGRSPEWWDSWVITLWVRNKHGLVLWGTCIDFNSRALVRVSLRSPSVLDIHPYGLISQYLHRAQRFILVCQRYATHVSSYLTKRNPFVLSNPIHCRILGVLCAYSKKNTVYTQGWLNLLSSRVGRRCSGYCPITQQPGTHRFTLPIIMLYWPFPKRTVVPSVM